MKKILRPCKNKVLVKLVGSKNRRIDNIYLPDIKSRNSTQVQIIALPLQKTYKDFELGEDIKGNDIERNITYNVGDFALLSYANTQDTFQLEAGDEINGVTCIDTQTYMFVHPDSILVTYK